MALKRAQGRPQRGVDDVGREKLLESARVIFRSRLPVWVSRQDIAHAAGVTPALVSYYFADKASLVLAATRPVIEQYARAALNIVECEEPYSKRFERLVMLFLQLSAEEGGMLDVYFAYACELDDNPAMAPIPGAWERLTSFVAAGTAAGAWRDIEPGQLLLVLWGMCRTIVQKSAIPMLAFVDASSVDGPRQQQAAFIVGLIRNGIHFTEV